MLKKQIRISRSKTPNSWKSNTYLQWRAMRHLCSWADVKTYGMLIKDPAFRFQLGKWRPVPQSVVGQTRRRGLSPPRIVHPDAVQVYRHIFRQRSPRRIHIFGGKKHPGAFSEVGEWSFHNQKKTWTKNPRVVGLFCFVRGTHRTAHCQVVRLSAGVPRWCSILNWWKCFNV